MMANRPLDNLLPRLDGVKGTRTGFVARCPAHADRNPSLSIREGDDGRVLLHCFAGCTAHEVVTAVGLSLPDLFPNDDKPHRPRPAPGVTRTALRAAAEFERQVLFMVAADRASGRPISAIDGAREQLAKQRIALAGACL